MLTKQNEAGTQLSPSLTSFLHVSPGVKEESAEEKEKKKKKNLKIANL